MSTEFKAIEDVLSSFGSKLIEKARANLNKKEKRANGTLFNEMSYDIEKTPNGVKFKMDFGSADDYWLFVDQGVEGAGGFKGSGKKFSYVPNEVVLNMPINAEPFTVRFSNMLTGWNATFTMQVNNANSLCNAPIEPSDENRDS